MNRRSNDALYAAGKPTAIGNHGTRVDCYARGAAVATLDSTPSGFTGSFGGTSSAAAIVAGVALSVQGMREANTGGRFQPAVIRDIFRNRYNGTEVEGVPDKVIPDLRKIILNELATSPDVYMRDFVGDIGDPHSGPAGSSPDIVVRQLPVADPQAAFGYRIDTPDRSVVISGDTRPSEALAAAARGVDVLVHEVYPEARVAPERRPGGEDWPRYLREYHTSDVELGRLAARAQPRLLILTHLVRMRATDEELIAGVRAGGFTGRTVIGRDLERY